jgi:hypothetical protein
MAAKPFRSANPGQISALMPKHRVIMPASYVSHTYQDHFTGATVDGCGLPARGGVRLIGGFGAEFYEISFAGQIKSREDWRWSSQSYSNP